jgi:hypothetical protein
MPCLITVSKEIFAFAPLGAAFLLIIQTVMSRVNALFQLFASIIIQLQGD